MWFMVVLLFLPMMLWMLDCWGVVQVSVSYTCLGSGGAQDLPCQISPPQY